MNAEIRNWTTRSERLWSTEPYIEYLYQIPPLKDQGSMRKTGWEDYKRKKVHTTPTRQQFCTKQASCKCGLTETRTAYTRPAIQVQVEI